MIKKGVIACIFLCWYFQVVAQSIDSTVEEYKPAKLELPEWVNHLVNDTGSSAKPRFLFIQLLDFLQKLDGNLGPAHWLYFTTITILRYDLAKSALSGFSPK